MDGDHACCEGALAAGCRFVAGYPITPSTAIIERFARRIPTVGGIFVQMEDEIASSIAIQGAVWTGMKAMTVTSGPGFSLMMEHVGFAAMTETPCVIVNVQRGGPSTGLPTLPGQADMMQARWGSHGDYKIIALCPSSPQECFDLCIEAFNLAERFRVPVFFMMDECVGHMMERVDIPSADALEVFPRRFTKRAPGEYLPYEAGEDLVPEMVRAGDGYKIHITGLTHDERGYPEMTPQAQARLVQRLVEKVHRYNDEITHIDEADLDDADVVILSYGISSRVATRAWRLAREEGIKVGLMNLKVVWPFPQNRVREVAESIGAFVVPEINMGQVSLVVQRYIAGRAEVELVPHTGGGVHDPLDILEAIRRVKP
ncbi:2-oxoacid:acceptor oxidoreductase subunit alpha [Thermodesulfobacteriota bacterium]